MNVMEVSHCGNEFMGIAAETEKNVRDIRGVPSDYKVLSRIPKILTRSCEVPPDPILQFIRFN
jgi:hypothetical protein